MALVILKLQSTDLVDQRIYSAYIYVFKSSRLITAMITLSFTDNLHAGTNP